MADDLFDGIQILNPRELMQTKEGNNSFSSDASEEEEINTNRVNISQDEDGLPSTGLRMLSPQELRKSDTKVVDENTEEDEEEDNSTKTTSNIKAKNLDIDVSALASVLSNKGLLELPEGTNIESEDDLLSLMSTQIDDKAEALLDNWIKGLPPKAQAYLGLVDEGVDANLATSLVESKAFINGLNENSNNDDLEDAYRLYLNNLGMSEDEINEEVEEAKDLSKLKDKALKAKSKLLTAITGEEQNAKVQVAERARQEQAQREQYVKTLETSIDSTDELVPGLKLTPKMKEKIKSSFLTAVEEKNGVPLNQVSATRSRNPQAFDTLLHYYTQLGLFNINDKGVAKPDISALRRKVATDATNSLLDIVTEKRSGGTESKATNSFLEKLSKFNN